MNKRKVKSKCNNDNTSEVSIPKRRRLEIEDKIFNKARPFIDLTESSHGTSSSDTLNDPLKSSKTSNSGFSNVKQSTTHTKTKKKKTKKKKKIKLPKISKAKASAQERALEYLNSWSIQDGDWRYNKKLHTWLMQNMYKKEVSEDSFKMLLKYSDSLKGPPRLKVIHWAEGIIKDCDCQMDAMPDAIPEECLTGYERARQVLQLIV